MLGQLLTDVAFQVCTEMVEAASVGRAGWQPVSLTISCGTNRVGCVLG